MNTKEKLARLLEESEGKFLSGSEIARKLGVTRAGIWKCIQQLEEEGYLIEAVRNRGYRLSDQNDVVSERCILNYLKEYEQEDETTYPFADAGIDVREEVTSTNDVLKERASSLPGWHCVIAGRQTRGKGRRTKSFYSPAGSGLYLSVLIRLPLPAEIATRITTASAVAACRAIEACTEAKPSIKWVNDVFVNGKKTCGILTEASISMESGALDWAVMGIGFNVYEPEDGFPEEIREIAGAITPSRSLNLRNQIAAAFLRHFYQICGKLESPALVEEYKAHSMMKGLLISVIKGDTSISAVAEDIDDDCRLIVRYPDGSREALSSGEVSIRMK